MNDNSNLKAGHDNNHKNTDSARNIQSVRKLFLSGGRYTAKEINTLCQTNDARKFISVLRNKENWNIVDCRMPDGCKLYWLEPDKRKTSEYEENRSAISSAKNECDMKHISHYIPELRKPVYDNQIKEDTNNE